MMFEYADDGDGIVSPLRDSWSSNAQYMYRCLERFDLDVTRRAGRCSDSGRTRAKVGREELLGPNTDSRLVSVADVRA